MTAVPEDFSKELARRFPHLECEWMPHGFFLNTGVQNRFVLKEKDRLGRYWEYMIIQGPQGQFREPGAWVFDRIQRDDMGREWLHRDAKRKFIASLEGKDAVDERKQKRNAVWRDKVRHEIKDKAYFAGNQQRVHSRNKLEGVR